MDIERNQITRKFPHIGRGYDPYAIRDQFRRFRARIFSMNEIVCTISFGGEVVELYIERTDPGIDFEVYCASINDQDGPMQIEYFEAPVDAELLELIQIAAERIQNGVN